MRLFKVLLVLVILALGGLAGYAYFGDMSANQTEMRKPVALDLGLPESSAPPALAPETETPPPATAPEAQTGGAASAQASDPNGID